MTKLFLCGQATGVSDDTMESIIDLHEVTIGATPKGLRKLAKHLQWAAKQMEKADPEDLKNGWHIHFQTKATTRPEIVIIGYPEDRGKIIYDEATDIFVRKVDG